MSKDTSRDSEWPQFSSEMMRQGPAIRKAHMTSLVRHLKEKHGLQTMNILEVGSWAGASTITWAKAIKDLGLSGSIHCVDVWEPYFDLKANDAEIYQQMNEAADNGQIFAEFQRNIAAAGVDDIVIFTKGRSREILPSLAAASYQIVFLDASHLYPDIYNDLVEAKRLVANQGIVCGDDFELSVGDVDAAAHKHALSSNFDFFQEPTTGISYHPGVSQAIADSFDAVSTWDGLWAVARRGENFETIDDLNYEPHIPEHLKSEAFSPPEIVSSELDFNIVRSQGRYIACRQSLGAVDFLIPLEVLTQTYPNSNLFVAATLEEALLRLCELTIASLKSQVEAESTVRLVESHLGFNVVHSQGQYAACRQSLGPIEFGKGLRSLAQKYSSKDFFFGPTRDEILLRICEIERVRLRRNIAGHKKPSVPTKISAK